MKLHKLVAALAIIHLGTPCISDAQIFNMPTQSLTFGVEFRSLGGFSSYRVGGITLNQTIVIEPSNNTYRRFGTIEMPSFQSPSFTFSSTQTLPPAPPVFPNPPGPRIVVTGDLTLSIASAGLFVNFDTGFHSLAYDANGYYISGLGLTTHLPISITHSLLTGGVTYSGTDGFIYNLELSGLGGQLGTENYPNSIQVESENFAGGPTVSFYTFTAANGFKADANVTLVPEPSVFAFIGIATACAVIRRKR